MQMTQARIERELLLCKVSILGPEYFEASLASKLEDARQYDPTNQSNAEHHIEEGTPAAYAAQQTAVAAAASHPGAVESYDHELPSLSPAEALRQKHLHYAAIRELVHDFQGKVLDRSDDCCTVEVSAKSSRIDAFLKLVRPFGILEACRTGAMAIGRSKIESSWRGMTDDPETMTEQQYIDAGMLPPG